MSYETKYIEYTRVKGPDPVVHLRDVRSPYIAVCRGRFAASTMDQHYDVNATPTCFWCVSRVEASTLQWFEWGSAG